MAVSVDSEFANAPSASLPNLVGTTIDNGNLKLLKLIGRGAWGLVYLATNLHTTPREFFAVKCVAYTDVSHSQRDSIDREVGLHTLCAEVSPKILQIITSIHEDNSGLLFIVSEYCPDGDLLEMILAKKFVGKNDLIKSTFLQILDAVEACHNMGIYHRDIKPENIMCKENGKKMVLADFGFATTEDATTEFRMGSEPFMSPEVRGGLRLRLPCYSSAKADIWALGIVLMNLVCGCLPWGKASIRDAQFTTYLYHDRDYLYHSFPISHETNEILKSIFTPDPYDRASIPELRKRILAVNSFGPGIHPGNEIYFADYEDIATDSDLSSTASSFSSSSFSGNTDVENEFEDEPVTLHHPAHVAPLAEILNSDMTAVRTQTTSTDSDIGPLRDTPRRIPRATRSRQNGQRRMRLDSSSEASSTSDAHSSFINDIVLSFEAIALQDVQLPPAEEEDEVDSNFCIAEEGDITDEDDEGPITPETHAADVCNDASITLVNLDEVPELDLGDASAAAEFSGASGAGPTPLHILLQTRQEDVKGKGKIPAFPVTEKDVAMNGQPSTKRMIINAARMMKKVL